MKIFTVEEANRMLPVLRDVVETIQDRMRWLSGHRPRIEYLVEEHRIPHESPVPADYFESLVQVRSALVHLEALGCQLKDIGRGLVDFPARLSGKPVLLCWCLGEESVGYYHDEKSGYAGRRPLPREARHAGRAPAGEPQDDPH